MNNNVQRQLSGGKIYNTVYAAGFSQNSAAGTQDVCEITRIPTSNASGSREG